MGIENGEENKGAVVPLRKQGAGSQMKKMARSAEELATTLKVVVVDVADAIRLGGKQSVLERTQGAMQAQAPRLKQATGRVVADVVQWMHQGGFWRRLLVSAVGVVSAMAMSGLMAFLMVVLLATANAAFVALLMCLSAVGAFMTMFFTLLTVIYLGALIATAVAIGSAVFMATCAVLFVTGWILFAWAVWEVMKMGLNLVKGTVSTAGNSVTTTRRRREY